MAQRTASQEERLKAITKVKLEPRKKGTAAQPVNKVEWVDRSKLHSNSYNPNYVASPELALLKISILEDGWTQPIVVTEDNEIVDGFHRWMVSADKDLFAMTGGKVPVVRISAPLQHRIMSTIRHNRARGKHGILAMASIVRRLVDEEGLSFEEVRLLMQMEKAEVERLYDSAGMRVRGAAEDFSKGWVPD